MEKARDREAEPRGEAEGGVYARANEGRKETEPGHKWEEESVKARERD